VRISGKFEERFLEALRSLASERQLAEIDHECTAVQYPVQQPDGTMSAALGISVTLACPSGVIGDWVMVTGLFEDPYGTPESLKAKTGILVQGLYRQRAAALAQGDGGLLIPQGA
jgi:hypothetical protein